MTPEDILPQAARIIRDTLQCGPVPITRETQAMHVRGWDSLSHVNLILAVESKFKIRFAQRELLTFRNVADLHNAIVAKLPA